jgi:UDP-N-acetylglucosamine diphosphorylase/glucosamine-1-phosphate N-acetyltransferase
MKNFDVIILAAGLGTRMKSDLAKVLHHIAGKPLIYYVLKTITSLEPHRIILVVGHQAKQVVEIVNGFGIDNILYVNQKEQLGTGHAVMISLDVYEVIADPPEFVLVLYGDVPFVKSDTLKNLIDIHNIEKPAISMLTTEVENATGYGRIIRDKNNFVINIIEEREATIEQKKIKEINPGFYCFNMDFLMNNIRKLSNDNLKGEYYLTDMIPHAASMGEKIIGVEAQNSEEVMGINTLEELKKTEQLFLEFKI